MKVRKGVRAAVLRLGFGFMFYLALCVASLAELDATARLERHNLVASVLPAPDSPEIMIACASPKSTSRSYALAAIE